jgi:5'-phosphate synthase pdxT subunit
MIGVLDLQGGVAEHLGHLQAVGIDGIRVKEPDDLPGLAGLILPGGESTCIGRLMRMFNLGEAIVREFRKGMHLWGTCAGAILLARAVVGEEPHLGLIDIEIERNGFGGQLDSFTAEARIEKVSAQPLPLTFIRAPRIVRAGPDVEILLRINGCIAAAESSQVLVTIFHPELSGNLSFHRYFAEKCGEEI